MFSQMFTFSKYFGPLDPNEKYMVKGKSDINSTAPKKGNASIKELDSLFKRFPTVKAIAMSVGIKAIRHRPIIKIFPKELVEIPCIHFGGSVILLRLIIERIIKSINSVIKKYFTIGLPPIEASCKPVILEIE